MSASTTPLQRRFLEDERKPGELHGETSRSAHRRPVGPSYRATFAALHGGDEHAPLEWVWPSLILSVRRIDRSPPQCASDPGRDQFGNDVGAR